MAEDNKEIVKSNGGIELPTTIDSKQWGVDIGPEDIPVPRLQLVQPVSAREGAGKFYYGLTGELFDSIECVVFSNQRGRVMFDPDMTKQQTICGSSDRTVPSERFEHPQAVKCVECKFSKRGYQEEVIIGKDKRFQYCSETQSLRCMFVETLLPFIFVGRRTSIKPVNDFLSYMQYECAKTRTPLCCFPIRMTTELIQKANTKYYVPKIERLGKIDREEFRTMMNKYANYDVDETFKAEDQANKAADDTPF